MLKKISIVKLLVSFAIIFCLWGFLLQQSVFANRLLMYVAFVIMLVLGTICIVQSKTVFHAVNIYAFIWFPYLIYTMINLLIQGSIEWFVYWFVCFVFLVIAQSMELRTQITYKLFFYSGMICLFGMWLQIMFPNFYNTYVADIFINSETIKNWAKWNYGYAGFTCQLGVTSIILIYLEGYILYILRKNSNKVLLTLALIFTIVSIFLTGKRMMSLISIVTPLIVYVFSEKKINRKRRNVFIGIIVGILFLCYFYSNLDMLSDNKVLGRIANSFIAFQNGEDITTNRNEISILAKNIFKDNAILGIGVNRFKEVSGFYTDVHNSFLQVLCEQGIIGIILFVFPLIVCYLKTISVLKSISYTVDNLSLKFSLFIQTIFILYSFTGNTTVDRQCFVIYFMSIGILVDYIKITQRRYDRQ